MGMTNGDFIRDMDNDRLARFLWTWGINTLTSFMIDGGTKVFDAQQLRKWLDGEEFECIQSHVSSDFIYDNDFNLKEHEDGNDD